MSAGTDVFAGGTSVIGISAEEIRSRRKPAVPDAASGINHGTLPIPDCGNRSTIFCRGEYLWQ